MSSILRRVALMALIMSTTVAVSMAAPYEAPKAVSTPSLDTSVLQGYSGDVNSVGVVIRDIKNFFSFITNNNPIFY